MKICVHVLTTKPMTATPMENENSFADIRHKMSTCERLRLAPSIAIFEPGFMRTALAYERSKLLLAPMLAHALYNGAVIFWQIR